MKATRIPTPITLEMDQQEAEMIAFLLKNVKAYSRSTQNMMNNMLNVLENVGVTPDKDRCITYYGGDFYIAYDVKPL